MLKSMMTKINIGAFFSVVFMWISFQECRSDLVQSPGRDDEVYTFVTESGATVTSPGFPGHYGNNLELVYRIQGPSSDVVRLTVTHIDIEGNLVNGCHDQLKIFDGDSMNKSNFLRSLCGFSLLSPVYSSSNEMELVFDTDATRSGTGFQAVVTFVNLEKSVTSPYADVERAFIMAYISLSVAVVTMLISLLGFSMLHMKQKKLSLHQPAENLTSVLSVGVGDHATNAYDIAAEKDAEQPDSTNEDDDNASHGYLRMRPSKKHMKISKTRKFHDDTEMYCEPDQYDTSIIKNEDRECMTGTDSEYHEPTNAEYEMPSGDDGYEKPSGMSHGAVDAEETGYDNPSNGVRSVANGNTTPPQDTYEAVNEGTQDETGEALCGQSAGGAGGTGEESTYYCKETYEAVSREIEESGRNAS